jgi:hypothetical protein
MRIPVKGKFVFRYGFLYIAGICYQRSRNITKKMIREIAPLADLGAVVLVFGLTTGLFTDVTG